MPRETLPIQPGDWETVSQYLGLIGSGPMSNTGDLVFTSDSDASGAGDIVLQSGGTERLRIAANGVVSAADQIMGSENERAHIYGTQFNPVSGAAKSVLKVIGTGRGTVITGSGVRGYDVLVQDHANVANKTITGAANNGSGLIRITATAHGYSTGDRIVIYGIVGTTEANAAWAVTSITANTFDLQGSTFVNAYVSGGTATNRPFMDAYYAGVSLRVDRGTIPAGATANADDVSGFVGQNVSTGPTGKAAECFYVAASPTVTGSAWVAGYAVDANVDWGLTVGNAGNTLALGGIDLASGVYTAGTAIRLPNNVSVKGRNAANNADVAMFKLSTSNFFEFQTTMQWDDGVSIVLGTITGSAIGSGATQKLGFWGATPVVRPTVTGSKGANAALASLMTALAGAGLVVDSTT